VRRQRLLGGRWPGRIFSRLVGLGMSEYGLVPPRRISALVDVAGFAYSDQWGAPPTRDLARLVSLYAARGKPVILLPQAFGPFRLPETRAAFAEALRGITLLFARDPESYEHVRELSPRPGTLHLAPDITFFSAEGGGGPPPSDFGVEPRVCLVPNVRLLDQGRQEWGNRYHELLVAIGRECSRAGFGVRVLIHDASGADLELGRDLHRALPDGTLLDAEADPVVLKATIGRSVAVIGSRYHALVAAFSQGVPAMGMGWSHKYATLFSDFGCSRYALTSGMDLEEVRVRTRELLDPVCNAALRRRISDELEGLRRGNREMWGRVIDALRSRASP
jgi:hypothetical protein